MKPFIKKIQSIHFLYFLIVISLTSGTNAETKRLNVVFFLVDDLGYGDLGYTGSKIAQTPNIDDFAAENTIFTHGFAASPHCSPSRAAILTGKYPARLHITSWIGTKQPKTFKNLELPTQKNHLPESHNTLGKYFQSQGYQTANVGKWHMGGNIVSPSKHGFNEVIGFAVGPGPGRSSQWFGPYPKIKDLSGPEEEYISDRLTDESIDFIKRNKEQPFFLMLQHYDVHKPFSAPEEMVKKYEVLGRKRAQGLENAFFLAMKQSMDESFGRIIQTLKKEKLFEKTILVFSSDNGGIEGLARNQPFRKGKKFFHEGGIRVPLLMRVPGRTNVKSVIDTPVHGIDFFPTLVELSGGQLEEIQSELDGISFASLFDGKNNLSRETLYWHQPLLAKGSGYIHPQGVVLNGSWKMIHYYGNTKKDELYDISKDPSEQRNFAFQYPEKMKQMRAKLMNHLKQVEAQKVCVKMNE